MYSRIGTCLRENEERVSVPNCIMRDKSLFLAWHVSAEFFDDFGNPCARNPLGEESGRGMGVGDALRLSHLFARKNPALQRGLPKLTY